MTAPAAPHPPRSRLFAVIPAAGHSRRMGRPKLLLPLGGQTVVARVLAALQHPDIAARVVVTRTADSELQAEVRKSGGTPISPAVDPPDMRASVEFGLEWLRAHLSPRAEDGWMLIPADHPVLDTDLVSALIGVWQTQRPRLLLPTYAGRRGHPLLVRWELAAAVRSLPPDRGVNALLADYAADVATLPVAAESVLGDLDNPDDYASLRAVFGD